MKHAHQIKSVAPGSIAEELELEPGDKILQINGQDIEDQNGDLLQRGQTLPDDPEAEQRHRRSSLQCQIPYLLRFGE